MARAAQPRQTCPGIQADREITGELENDRETYLIGDACDVFGASKRGQDEIFLPPPRFLQALVGLAETETKKQAHHPLF
jgi:hypothetical protein